LRASLTVLLLLPAILFMAGCGEQKLLPVEVGDLTEYKDPVYNFSIKYPARWKQLGTIGKALFTESQEMASKFIDPAAGIEGAQVIVEVLPYAGRTKEAVVSEGTDALKTQQAEVQPASMMGVAGVEAVRIPYSLQATAKTKIFGFELYVPGDTAVYRITAEGYGGHFEAYKPVFDAMVGSFVLPVIVAKAPDHWIPSPTLAEFPSPFFTMQYPDNMNVVDVKKGDKDFVMEMRADRQDVSIHIDVFGAANLTVDKVWEQNKGRYKARGSGETTIDGQKAYWVDYTPMKEVSSRAIFAVKNDKVVRTTLNWYAPQKDIYFPVLEGMVRSLKLK
jgi:hypothetical protein